MAVDFLFCLIPYQGGCVRLFLHRFWREINGKAPLVEANPEDPTKARVTFIGRAGDNVTSVLLSEGVSKRQGELTPVGHRRAARGRGRR